MCNRAFFKIHIPTNYFGKSTVGSLLISDSFLMETMQQEYIVAAASCNEVMPYLFSFFKRKRGW